MVPLIIDCHGHYTTFPPAVGAWREAQKSAFIQGLEFDAASPIDISDDELRESIEGAQLALQRERGIDLTIFSPRASWMEHHVGDQAVSLTWTRQQNDLIRRICDLFPTSFAPVAQLPQSPGADLTATVAELRRCVEELGFIGCNVNPDPSGGHFDGPPLWDPYWSPLWETMQELDVPGMIHVSGADNDYFHTTGSYYLSADTTAFMQALSSGFMRDYPGLRLIIPHGGGAVPYHWGRFAGMAQDKGWDLEGLMEQVYFDTCVYHQPGIDLLVDVIAPENILFGTEMIGAVRGKDARTDRYWDDTGYYIEHTDLPQAEKDLIYSGNALRVFPRLAALLEDRSRAS